MQLLRSQPTRDRAAKDGDVAAVGHERGELDAGEDEVDVGVRRVGPEERLRGAAERIRLGTALRRRSSFRGDGRRRIEAVLRDRQPVVRVGGPGEAAGCKDDGDKERACGESVHDAKKLHRANAGARSRGGGELAARGGDVAPAGEPHGGRDAGAIQHALERGDRVA